jgi:hypothetical protein
MYMNKWRPASFTLINKIKNKVKIGLYKVEVAPSPKMEMGCGYPLSTTHTNKGWLVANLTDRGMACDCSYCERLTCQLH